MTIHEAYRQLRNQLENIYEGREAIRIAELVIESISGFTRIERIISKDKTLTDIQQNILEDYTTALLNHTPVQYVLHEVWFAGMKFFVDENVLIPRPETEELVEWIAETVNSEWSMVNGESLDGIKKISLIDIGTGSGCIPIALKKKFAEADVYGIDVSERALNVARRNALYNNADVHFENMNILDKSAWQALPSFDIIVSNPPYITQSEANEMQNNVLMHEPHIALFVPDNDPLLFYKNIAEFALLYLRQNGLLFFEINEAFGKELMQMLTVKGFIKTEIKKDLQGKERMISGRRR